MRRRSRESEDQSDDPETALAKKDKGAAMRQCLTALSAEHREIIDLVYYHEKSVEEAAEIVGIPRGDGEDAHVLRAQEIIGAPQGARYRSRLAMNTANEGERKDIEELLPWHAAGTLSRRDAQRVEAALAKRSRACASLRTGARGAWRRPSSSTKRWARRRRARWKHCSPEIDAEPPRKAASLDLGVRASAIFSLASRHAPWRGRRRLRRLPSCCRQASSRASCSTSKGVGGYETASVPAAVKGEGAYALIRFQPQASAADITKFLETNKLTLTGGPTAGGLYRVKVAPKPLAEGRARQSDQDITGGYGRRVSSLRPNERRCAGRRRSWWRPY